MYKLRKVHEPFGTKVEPQYESSYGEGMIPVIDGICEVRLPETRERLIKLGYVDAESGEPAAPGSSNGKEPLPVKRKAEAKKKKRR